MHLTHTKKARPYIISVMQKIIRYEKSGLEIIKTGMNQNQNNAIYYQEGHLSPQLELTNCQFMHNANMFSLLRSQYTEKFKEGGRERRGRGQLEIGTYKTVLSYSDLILVEIKRLKITKVQNNNSKTFEHRNCYNDSKPFRIQFDPSLSGQNLSIYDI